MKTKTKVLQRYPFNASGLEDARTYLNDQARRNPDGEPTKYRFEFFDNRDVLTAVIEFHLRPTVPRGVYSNSANHDYSQLARMAGKSTSVRGDLIAFNLPPQDFRRFRSALESRGFYFETSGLSNKSPHELKQRV